jgi:cell division protein FtsI (penicillin-binding protein 3)
MMSHGYEIQLTPLQILCFYNAVANNGKMVKPILVKEIKHHGSVVQKFEPEVINPSICSYSTIQKAKKMLEGVVENGTARNLENDNYKIAGKTGTAQIANEKYGYKVDSKTSYLASFVGYFPAEAPEYSCIVVVSSPSKDVYYGNLVAGPVFKEIADKVYASSPELQEEIQIVENKANLVLPAIKNGNSKELKTLLNEFQFPVINNAEGEWVEVKTETNGISLSPLLDGKNLVPEVRGMGLKDAVFLLENKGLVVEVYGRGKVVQQSIRPGAKIKKGDKIILTLALG